jgi:RHS repeat-associated protein
MENSALSEPVFFDDANLDLSLFQGNSLTGLSRSSSEMALSSPIMEDGVQLFEAEGSDLSNLDVEWRGSALSDSDLQKKIINNSLLGAFEDDLKGVFQVGSDGQVAADFLLDSGGYQSQVGIFSLEGMDEFVPGSQAFIEEAARRAASGSELGHILISDVDYGARFSGQLGESNRNRGDYLGAKTVSMRPGDLVALMLVPNGTVSQTVTQASLQGSQRALFSMASANPGAMAQLAQVMGDLFAWEDLRLDQKSDRDYNDIIFKLQGVTGTAAEFETLVAPNKDWRGLALGQTILEHASSGDVTPPGITAGLTNDTGVETTDGLTADPSIAGLVTDASPITALKAQWADSSATDFVDVLSALNDDGTFALTQAQLEQIKDAPLTDGEHKLLLQAVDAAGNQSEIEMAFTLDQTAPQAAVNTQLVSPDFMDISFNELMAEAALDLNNYALKRDDGQAIEITSVEPLSGQQLRLHFDSPLATGEYGLVVEPSVGDLAGNALEDGVLALTVEEEAEAITWQFAYDDAGQIAQVIDPAGQVTAVNRTFDAQDNLQTLTRTLADGTEVTLQLDNFGRLAQMTDEAGKVTYDYDEFSRVIGVRRQGQPDITYTYDSEDRISSMTVGDDTTHYTYDHLGRLKTMETSAGVVSYEYQTGQGQLIRTLPNGVKTIWTFRPDGNLERLLHGLPNQEDPNSIKVIAEFTYAYRPDGLISEIKEFEQLGAEGQKERTLQYTYDEVQRLKAVDDSSQGRTEYEYDEVGNRVEVRRPNEEAITSTYDELNRLTSHGGQAVTYDEAGNLTGYEADEDQRTFTYESTGQLDTVITPDQVVDYDYDGDGNLIARTVNGQETAFLADPLSDIWQPLRATNENGETTNFIWEGETPLMSQSTDGEVFFLHDHLGSVRYALDADGNILYEFDYTAFGEPETPIATPGLQPGFTGLFFDPNADLHLTRARGYESEMGQFLQPDPQHRLPFGSQKDYSDYIYSGGDSVNFIDRDGEEPVSIAITLAGAFLSGAIIGAAQDFALQTALIAFENREEYEWGNIGILPVGNLGLQTISIMANNWDQYDWKSIGSSALLGGFGGSVTAAFRNTKLFLTHIGKQFSHSIPRRTAKTSKWLVEHRNAKKYPLALLNGEYISPKLHYKIDPLYNGAGRVIGGAYLRGSGAKKWGAKFGRLRQVVNRVPAWMHASYAVPSTSKSVFTTYHALNPLAVETSDTLQAESRQTTVGSNSNPGSLIGGFVAHNDFEISKPVSSSNIGGIYLSGAAQAIEDLGPLSGIAVDEETDRLILLSKEQDDLTLPSLRLDDLTTIFDAVYNQGTAPFVSIDPNPDDPYGSTMLVRHDPVTDETYVGWTLFEADRVMKAFSLGTDNNTEEPVFTTIPGYKNLLDPDFADVSNDDAIWERFWIVPAEVNRQQTTDQSLTLLDVPLEVRTERMELKNGVLVPAADPTPSEGAAYFSDWFTENYDAIAAEVELAAPDGSGLEGTVQPFAELQQMALITGIAEALQDQGIPLPKWMWDQVVTPVSVPDTTPAITAENTFPTPAGTTTQSIYGGADLSPDDGDVFTEIGNPATEALADTLFETAETQHLLTPFTFDHGGEIYNAVALPGNDTQALGGQSLQNVDLVVPMTGGSVLSLERKFHSFFKPDGVLGSSWTLDLPTLRTQQRTAGSTGIETTYQLTSPLNTWSAYFTPDATTNDLVSDQPDTLEPLAVGNDDRIGTETTLLRYTDGREWHFDEAGQLVAWSESPLTVIYRRNDQNQVVSIEGWYGDTQQATINLTYDTEGQLVSATGSDGSTVTYTYDDTGNLGTVETADRSVDYTYDERGLVTGIQTDDELVATFAYSDLGELQSEWFEDGTDNGETLSYAKTYKATGIEVTATDEDNQVMDTILYDFDLRPLERTFEDGTQIEWQYLDNGDIRMPIVLTDGEQYVVTQSADGGYSTLELPEGGIYTAEYDAVGRLTQLTQGNDVVLTQEWNTQGQLELVTSPTTLLDPAYDANGVLTSLLVEEPTADGWLQTHYDATGQVTQVKDSAGANNQFSYDSDGDLIQLASTQGTVNLIRNESGDVTEVTTSWGYSQSNQYDADGDLVEMNLTQDSQTANIRLSEGQLTEVEQFDGGVLEFAYYNPDEFGGQLQEIRTPNGLELQYTYDDVDLLTGVKVGEQYSVRYAYNDQGQLTEITQVAV